MNILLYAITLLIASNLVLARTAKRAKKDIVRTVKFGNCDDSFVRKPELSHFENITITNVGKGMNVINGQFVHKKDVEAIYGLYQIFVCKTQNEEDCEVFGNYKHDDYCDIMTKTGAYWTPLWGAFHPRAKCPFAKNVYQIKNATIDAQKLLAMAKFVPNMYEFFWMSKSAMFTLKDRKQFGCMMMMFQFAQVRM